MRLLLKILLNENCGGGRTSTSRIAIALRDADAGARYVDRILCPNTLA
jgi:hypothetical protein